MEWKQITNSNYEISSDGQVRNKLTGFTRKQQMGGTAKYLMVGIRLNDGKFKNCLINV